VTLTLPGLRARAIEQTLFREESASAAFARLAFVQADPIRAPARAQDLILRQRVAGYLAGDLEREYPNLNIEEGLLYAYGFLLRPLWQLSHPPDTRRLPRFEQRVLEAVQRLGQAHPEGLRAEFGRKTALNAWGQSSSLTKLALEQLHRRGLVRVARRESGIRVYEPCPPPAERPPPEEVFRRLLLAVIQLLAPISERSLRAVALPLARKIPGLVSARLVNARAVLHVLEEHGTLARGVVDAETYLWPVPGPNAGVARVGGELAPGAEDAPRLRFLAPFDPVVWDRRRFEHLWGWAYRFEAYTPSTKRLRGYYALPMLWRDRVIGWANLQVLEGGLDVELGFVGKRPRDAAFRNALSAEVEDMRRFLGLTDPVTPGLSEPAADPSAREDSFEPSERAARTARPRSRKA
jgi:uncharacterized protein YcaQ